MVPTPLHAAHARVNRKVASFMLAIGVLALAAMPVRASTDAARQAGIWTLSVDQTNRACRINLRQDPAGNGWGLAMPPGCRRAVPALKTVQSWSMPSDEQVSFDDDAGQTVVAFGDQNAQGLHATDGEGEALTLTPYRRSADPGQAEDPIVSLVPAGEASQPAAIAPTLPGDGTAAPTAPAPAVRVAAAVAPTRPQDAAGRYAVLRGDRDTGCMVTLDPTAPGPKNTRKARLAPACRDQGIVIFDPLGWQVQGSQLVLTARKGHTIAMDRTADGVWIKEPKDFKALGLKPL